MGGLGSLVLLSPFLPHLWPHNQHVLLPVEDEGGEVGEDETLAYNEEPILGQSLM